MGGRWGVGFLARSLGGALEGLFPAAVRRSLRGEVGAACFLARAKVSDAHDDAYLPYTGFACGAIGCFCCTGAVLEVGGAAGGAGVEAAILAQTSGREGGRIGETFAGVCEGGSGGFVGESQVSRRLR